MNPEPPPSIGRPVRAKMDPMLRSVRRLGLCALAVACAASADPEWVWLSKPDGCRQCERCGAPTLREIVADLERAGVRVDRSTVHHVAVCLACSVCASGREYAVRVERAQLEKLEQQGWSPMRELPSGEPAR